MTIDVTSIVGQKVISLDKGYVATGTYRYDVNCEGLSPGIYFYTVRVNNQSITNKMVIEKNQYSFLQRRHQDAKKFLVSSCLCGDFK